MNKATVTVTGNTFAVTGTDGHTRENLRRDEALSVVTYLNLNTVAEMMENGTHPCVAFDAVFGAGAYERLAGEVYDSLRGEG